MQAGPGEGPSSDQTATDAAADDPGPAARRQSVVLAGFTGDVATALAARRDPDGSVRAAALSALDRLGFSDQLANAADDGDPRVRRRLAELLTRACRSGRVHPGPAVDVLLTLVADTDPSVVEVAAWALGELTPLVPRAAGLEPAGRSRAGDLREAAVAALVALATTHVDPLCREAAVAALGAIGDPAGLPAVLAALGGRPPLRRRAAVALAAFDDPTADAALERCLGDRDWQVREVAEELLGLPPRELAAAVEDGPTGDAET